MLFGNKGVKKFIYGVTGYGKSYTLIAPILRKRRRLIYVTGNGINGELKCMGLPENFLRRTSVEEIGTYVNRIGIDLAPFPESSLGEQFLKVIYDLNHSPITKTARNTVIFSGVPYEILSSPMYMQRIEEWKANVVIDCMCNSEFQAKEWFSYILNSPKWEKVPVFDKLF